MRVWILKEGLLTPFTTSGHERKKYHDPYKKRGFLGKIVNNIIHPEDRKLEKPKISSHKPKKPRKPTTKVLKPKVEKTTTTKIPKAKPAKKPKMSSMEKFYSGFEDRHKEG